VTWTRALGKRMLKTLFCKEKLEYVASCRVSTTHPYPPCGRNICMGRGGVRLRSSVKLILILQSSQTFVLE